MSNDAVEYVYINVGYTRNPSLNAVEYTYVNIGLFGVPAHLGRIWGYAGRLLLGIVYAYINVLEYVTGAARITEDGNVRITEDGNRRVTE